MQAVATSRGSDAIRVGQVAYRDPILARASLEAAQLLKSAVDRPKDIREDFVRGELRGYGPGAALKFTRKLAKLSRRGLNRNQAIFDSLRMVIADYYTQLGVEAIQAAMAQAYDADRAGLGEDVGRQVGCAITGGATAIIGSILGVFTGGAGSSAAAVGGSLIGAGLDCGHDERVAQQQIAEAQARQAQAVAEQARIQAESQERLARIAAESRTKQIVTVALVGGSALVLALAGYAIVKA